MAILESIQGIHLFKYYLIIIINGEFDRRYSHSYVVYYHIQHMSYGYISCQILRRQLTHDDKDV